MAHAGSAEPLIRLRGLVKRWGPRLALAGIDLELSQPAVVGVVGPDGAGKSTLLRALAGLLDVEAAEARVLGFDLRSDVTALKARIGYVPQVWSLHPALSVEENLRFTARLHRLDEATCRQRTTDLLERTQLAAFRHRPAGALSGGMKQKLAVACALLPAPALLLLDEPTAGIDVLARAELWNLFTAARASALVVTSTSYLEEAAACDILVCLDRGQVLACTSPTALPDALAVECYRAWTDATGAVVAAARTLPYVGSLRPRAAHVRIDVPVERSPGPDAVLRDLHGLPGVHFAERIAPDMEAALLGLARGDGQ